LLEHGADPSVWDDNGQTLLHAASRSGNLKFIQCLLELSVGVNSCDNQGRTPLHVIEWWYYNHVRLSLLLIEGGADQTLQDNDGHTPLHAIARWGKLNVTQWLLEFDLGDLNEEDNEGQTWFDYAEQWCKNFSLLLLKRGADPGVRDNNGQTALHVASCEGNLSIIQQLLKFDVDLKSHDSHGQTPFRIAMEEGHDKVEKLLLEHGTERP